MREMRSVGPATVAKLVEQGAVLVDVREAYEHSAARIPGSVNVPLSRLQQSEINLTQRSPVVFFCASGSRTAIYAEQLAAKAADRQAYVLQGGIAAWARAGFPIDNSRPAGGQASPSLFSRLFGR